LHLPLWRSEKAPALIARRYRSARLIATAANRRERSRRIIPVQLFPALEQDVFTRTPLSEHMADDISRRDLEAT
jgi:hypothetical protein